MITKKIIKDDEFEKIIHHYDGETLTRVEHIGKIDIPEPQPKTEKEILKEIIKEILKEYKII